jgi:hypothetical protein
MAEITEDTSIEELAVIISEALEAAGITDTCCLQGVYSRIPTPLFNALRAM